MGQVTLLVKTHTGIGKLVSLLSFVGIVTIVPTLFKAAWPKLLALSETLPINPDLGLYIGIVIGINLIVIGVYNLVMCYIYQAKIPFFERYRNSDRPWPWEVDSAKWRTTLYKTIGTVLFNIFLINSLLPTFEYFTGGMLYQKSLQNWPTAFTILWQFVFFEVVEGTMFYWTHYLFHKPQFYWIHKKHHEYSTTISLAAIYAHPIEHIVSNAIPSGYGYHLLAKVTSVHYVTIAAWLVFRLIETCDGHSGYNWSWGQLQFNPWKLSTEYHDFHHSHNVGNYASMFGFWDSLMGTNKVYYDYKLRKQ